VAGWKDDAEIPEWAGRPFWLGDGPRGVLLLHGFAGTPVELIRLGEWLAGHGILAHAPLLAGHGTSPEEMARTRADDWIRSANQGLDELLARCRTVGVAGQSMGGTIALHLAATRPEVLAVATQAAMLRLSDWRLRLLPALHPLVRWDRPSGKVDLYLPERAQLLHSYRRRPTRAILELVRLGRRVEGELRAIWQPLLVLHGGRDGVVGPANADRILGGVSSPIRELRLFPRSGHGMSVDVDSPEVAELAGRWFLRHLPEVPA
jgi:carboxylesterase